MDAGPEMCVISPPAQLVKLGNLSFSWSWLNRVFNLFILLTVWKNYPGVKCHHQVFFFHRAAGSVFMQNASSDVFFNSCLNQKEEYVLRFELGSGERWLRVPQLVLRAGGCVEVKGFAEAPDFSRAASEWAAETQFIFSFFLFSLSHFPPHPFLSHGRFTHSTHWTFRQWWAQIPVFQCKGIIVFLWLSIASQATPSQTQILLLSPANVCQWDCSGGLAPSVLKGLSPRGCPRPGRWPCSVLSVNIFFKPLQSSGFFCWG